MRVAPASKPGSYPEPDAETISAAPAFSIITVCLNAEQHVAEALDSVLGQSYADFELLVVDGGSTDGTLDVVRQREANSNGRLRWVSEPDDGLYDAMNKGLALASGRFVAYLGADDHLAPGALDAVARAIAADSALDMISGATRVLGPHGDWDEPASTRVRRGLPVRAPARHQSIFVRASALRAAGGFDTRYRIAADYDSYLKLHEAGVREALIAEMLSEFRLGGASSQDARATARDYRDVRIAHGANPLVEGVVMRKSVLGVWLHAAMMRMRRAAGSGAAPSGTRAPRIPSAGDRPPRVLVVSLGRRGGVTEYGYLMSKALSQRCDVAAISSTGADNRERWPELGVPHLEVKTFGSVPGMLLSSLAIWRFIAMRRFAREFCPDVIYYPGGHAWKPLLDFILPRSAITILTVHDPELHSGEDTFPLRLLAAVNRLHVYGYVLLNNAQRGAFIKKHRLPPTSVTVIPLGIFDGFLDARAPLAQFEALSDLEPLTGRLALFVGRIRRYKGISTLLTAYRAIPDGLRMPLVIAGSGEFSPAEKDLLDSQSPGEVHVVNRWLSDAEISSLVGAARFVVLPYNSATQSGVIPLASAFGTPAIASDTGGLAEQVVNGETGMLFSAGNADELAITLERAFLMSEFDYQAMSASAHEYAEANWSWDVLVGRLLDFVGMLSGPNR